MSDTMTQGARQPAGRQAAGRNGQQTVALRPFVAGTRNTDEPIYDETRNLTSSSVDLPSLEIDPNGFLRGMWVLVEATTTGNTATVASAEDGPFSVLDLVNHMDTNSQPLVGPINGYDLYLIQKYGGYHFQDDAKKSSVFSQTTGANTTSGSFTFLLWIPAELVRRDALGSLTNKNAASTFSLSMRLAPLATVFTTPPSSTLSVRVRVQLEGWQDPNISDIRGNPVAQDPPGIQTTQFWHKQIYPIASGAMNQRLLGIDSLVRNLIIIARDETGSRSGADNEFPDPFTLQYETAITRKTLRSVWRHKIASDFGYDAAVGAAGGRDNGVYPMPFNLDFFLKPGAETRFSYLPVSSATNIIMSGTVNAGGVSSYTILVNKVVPAGGNPMVLTGGR